MKAVVAAFNQEKALVGAFSVIVKTDGSFAALVQTQTPVVRMSMFERQPSLHGGNVTISPDCGGGVISYRRHGPRRKYYLVDTLRPIRS